jgi:nucleotide-binding universal stress UspA family protein
MGTLGRTGIQRFLLGSVAENVVRHSKKSVLVVRGETV